MEGYSGKPLFQKLGIKPGTTVVVIKAPKNYRELLGELPAEACVTDRLPPRVDFAHFFTTRRSDLEKELKLLRAKLSDAGTLWVSWPKKSSNVPSDLDENVIRNFALKNGLVDIKVCAVDEVWSGLKLVIPVKER